jgi:hypothetical protein
MGSSNPGTSLNPQVIQATTINLSGPSKIVWATFADGDTTPDVSAATYFKTANTGATTITDFDGATNATIVINITDANTTIAHNANIRLQGGLAFTGAANDVIRFVHNGSAWLEETRSANA